MKYVRRQNGFAHVVMIALVAVLLVVVGMAVWQWQQSKAKSSTSSSTTPAPVASASVVATPANVIKVTELGFKMTLPAGLTDLKYTAQTNQTGSGSDGTSYTLSTSNYTTTALLQQDPLCTAANNPIGSIVRYPKDPKTYGVAVAQSKQVGTFYLAFVSPQSTCSDKVAVQQLETSQIQLLRQAFDTATAL